VVLSDFRFDDDIHSLSVIDDKPGAAGWVLAAMPFTAPLELVRGGMAVGDCSECEICVGLTSEVMVIVDNAMS
jgi:hypothetical protein